MSCHFQHLIVYSALNETQTQKVQPPLITIVVIIVIIGKATQSFFKKEKNKTIVSNSSPEAIPKVQ